LALVIWAINLPADWQVRQLLTAGRIGDVQVLTADLGFRAEFDPKSRLFDPNLGGGALLDVGIYPVALASMLFGPPAEITSMVQLGQTGVDERSAVILGYEGGQRNVLFTHPIEYKQIGSLSY
jgi:predicted dehydrogenase